MSNILTLLILPFLPPPLPLPPPMQEKKQTLKLSLYAKLLNILTLVTATWCFFLFLLMLQQYGVIPWPWRYAWVWQACGQLGYFIALCMVAWTWGPSNISSQLAHSMQLATSEDDAVEMTRGSGPGRGVSQEDVNVFSIDDEEDEEEDEGLDGNRGDVEEGEFEHKAEPV